ncbi:MAG: hypothetical protein AB1489_23555 [Acidobacteriota bacterium]
MPTLKIKTEKPPERCDICHQSDLYNAENDYCSRCNEPLPEDAIIESDDTQLEDEIINEQVYTLKRLQIITLKVVTTLLMLVWCLSLFSDTIMSITMILGVFITIVYIARWAASLCNDDNNQPRT